jgi:cytochrome c oxidase subunit 1
VHFWLTFVGVYCIFMPMHFLGMVGRPRRYADLTGVNFLAPLHNVEFFISIAAFITIGAQFIFLYNFIHSLGWGKKAEENPWRATTLEWTIPSPPPFDNFAGRHVQVYRGPYEFSVPGAPQDFIPQDEAPVEVHGVHNEGKT